MEAEVLTLRLQQRLDDYMTNLRKRLGLDALGLGPFLPPHVFELVRGGLLQQPEELCLEQNQIEALPTDIELFSQLLVLQCSDNRLYSLPKQLAALTSLQRLELDRNVLTSFPPCIGQLKQLTFLSVDSNQIGELPASIGTVTLTRHARLCGPLWSDRELTQLETLHLSNNKLTYLPLEMNRLSCLQHLSIDNNKFVLFPPVVPQILQLRTLSFAFNDNIKEIAPLHSLTQLEKLHVEEGKRFNIPKDLVPSGPDVIFLYLNTLGRFPSIHVELEQHWIPDEQASRCAICQANFTTLFRKGAHRVCDECFSLLTSKNQLPKRIEKAKGQDWGLTEADYQSLSEEQQRKKLAEQLTKINALITSKTSSRNGLEKLVGFYANDLVAQKKAIAEVQQMNDLLSSLTTHQATITQQLQALGAWEGSEEPTGLAAATTADTMEKSSEGMKAKVLYTFQAQSEGEIGVVAGAVVTLLDEQPNGEWWLIEYNGLSGYIPQTYLSPIF